MWKKQRKILNHSFSQKRIDSYSRVFIDEAESLAYRLSKLVVRRNRDVQNVVLTCFTNTICRTLFDVKYEMDIETHVKELDRLLGNVARRGVRWFSHWSTPTSSVTEEFEKSWSYGKQIGGDIISEKRRQLAEIKELTEVGIDLERTKETFMLDNILERPEFTDQRAMSELLLFIIAGSETSSSTLLFTFIALAIYPDIQERLYEDVVKVCGLDGPVTLEHLSHVEYVERVIKETLRIFAVAPILGRYIQEDLDIGDMVLPKGSTVFLNVIHTHRNAKYWPDPLKFDPDRFLQKNASKIVPFSFIPFSHGFRNCIGHKYAMTSLKITLITIIRKVKIFTAYKTIGEVRVKSHFTLRPMMGWKLWFEARS
ncbi:unnamed protein product [Callosobruchus maculatus]|uniref:Cytochrome P450 n=1 Tax=Callosobruchus maculatus TaxID=64391 RepID=A0A653DHN3_CALMS|nr:unnamed protein product [Callosobruchus maculatus]